MKKVPISFAILILGASASIASIAQAAAPRTMPANGLQPKTAATTVSDTPFVPAMPAIPATTAVGNVYDASDAFDAGTTRDLLALAGALGFVGILALQERALRSILARLFPSYHRKRTAEAFYASQTAHSGMSAERTFGQA